jgi:chloramphenicol O-acetyltransferase type A
MIAKQIDINTWNRKEHFEFFYRMDYPQFNVCMNIDVTRLVAFCKKEKLSFYYAMIHAVTKAANEIENFKYRIRDGKVVLHDTIHPSFTQIDESVSADLFKILLVDFTENIKEFVMAAGMENVAQKLYFDPQKLTGRDDLLYITCIPWITFTQVSHPISLDRNDSVPRISWGKYYHDGDKIFLPFSVQGHHALMDGFHVGKYVDKLQEYMSELL